MSPFQSKHPHVIYEYVDSSPQGCAVTQGYGDDPNSYLSDQPAQLKSAVDSNNAGGDDGGGGRRRKPGASSTTDKETEDESGLDHLNKFLNAQSKYFNVSMITKRDIRDTRKYIELALVIDKAMFDKRPHTKRKDVITDAIQVVNVADLVRK